MIRDVFIINQSGINLYHGHFGECHSIDADPDLFSSFVSAVQIMCRTKSGTDIKNLEIGKWAIYFYQSDNFVTAMISEAEDDEEKHKANIKKIAQMFSQIYDKLLNSFNGSISIFQNFGNILIEKGFTQKNCGKYPLCNHCEDSDQALPLEKFINSIEQSESYCED